MAVSQFTIYSSSDPGNGSDQPGQMFGAAGDLLRVLDKCLVNGYTGKAAAGWTKPVANSSNSGCYKQGAGSLLALHIQDNGGNVTSTFKEAWATGWETITAVNATVGAGTGQFPTPAQLNTTGFVVIRKSATADSTTQRSWIIFADASTFYLFIHSENETSWSTFMFGDIYSMKPTTDSYKCAIMGQTTQNTVPNAAINPLSLAGSPPALSYTAQGGFFMARTWGGLGASITCLWFYDYMLGYNNSNQWYLSGFTGTPNATDQSLYLSPMRVCEASAQTFRGRLRGAVVVEHLYNSFGDGQTIQGSGDFAGKTFQAIKGLNGGNSSSGGSIIWMETSNTVETN